MGFIRKVRSDFFHFSFVFAAITKNRRLATFLHDDGGREAFVIALRSCRIAISEGITDQVWADLWSLLGLGDGSDEDEVDHAFFTITKGLQFVCDDVKPRSAFTALFFLLRLSVV